MSIPNFNEEGNLPPGIHKCSGKKFLSRFCEGNYKRQGFFKPVSDIFDYAKNKNARYIFIGGSFVTENEEPNDIDCLIVFSEDKYIPSKTERIAIANIRLDVMFASMENQSIIDTYLTLFTKSRFGQNVGIIQIDLYDNAETWEIRHHPDESQLEIVKRAYINRDFIDLNEPVGVLVTIHGLYSQGIWNNEIAPICSSQRWIFAPFTYDASSATLLTNSSKRQKVLDEFREWIYEIQQRFGGPISIIAHSFGSYLITSYITGFDIPPVAFDSIILTGSIIKNEFDWSKEIGRSVGRIYNVIAPNDEWVKFMPPSLIKKVLGMDQLFGKSGLEGFEYKIPSLQQSKSHIFTHSNTIKRDVIETKWMPFLNANRGIFTFEMTKKIIADNK